MRLTRATAQILFVASLTACGYSRFDASDSDRGDRRDEADCADAVDACDSYALAFCSRASACGFQSFSDCLAGLEQSGWVCDFAEDRGGDMEECVQAVDAMTCDGFGSGNAFNGSACETATIEFGADVCDENGGGDGGGGSETPDITPDPCTCISFVTPGSCGGKIGCTWLSNDTANPASLDGTCSGLCSNF